MSPTKKTTAPRRGLVLGAGGVLGASWTIGALGALQEATGWDPREAEVIIGTSAGSVLAALLGGGLGVEQLLNHQRGVIVEGDPRIEYDSERASGGALPPRPKLGIGSRQLLMRAARHPRKYPPLAIASAIAPRGRGTLDPVGVLVDAVVPAGEWVPHPKTWIIAMDYANGKRVAFGRPGAPHASLHDAVMASCAIPGWYTPVTIDERRYVDGGACSPTSLDLLVDQGLDEVFVLSPMTSFTYDDPESVVGRLERRFRRAVTKRLQREAAKVRHAGTKVVMLGPGREDLEAIGVNLMDPRRRDAVLATSLRTSRVALDEALRGGPGGFAAAG